MSSRVGGHDYDIIIGVDGDDVSILYFAWKATEYDPIRVTTDSRASVTATVRDKLSGVVRRIKPGHRCLIIIDWLIADRDSFGSAVVEISELLSWFRSVYTEEEGEEGVHRSIITIIVGVSDSIRGVPGLEKCNELVDALIRSYPELREKKTAVLVKVYGINRDEFVGGGLLLEPDAGSDVFQVLCYESEDDYANGDQLIMQRLFEMNDRVIAKLKSGGSGSGSGSAMIKLESTAMMPQDIRCLLIFMIGAMFFIFIAVAVKVNEQ